PVIRSGADFAGLVRGRNERDPVVEHTRKKLLFLAEGVEVYGFACGLQVTGAHVLALDGFILHQGLERRDRFERHVEQLARARFAKLRYERGRLELEAREHLPAVARTGAPPGVL